ncbi:MAG: hypothetical protein J0H68_04685 [Sphingobacteriia bacterium]|nr:hypothetical protein [Sphingobacteriia bacterium]
MLHKKTGAVENIAPLVSKLFRESVSTSSNTLQSAPKFTKLFNKEMLNRSSLDEQAMKNILNHSFDKF